MGPRTVLVNTARSAAICVVDRASPSRRSTSSSRVLSCSGPARPGPAGAAGRCPMARAGFAPRPGEPRRARGPRRGGPPADSSAASRRSAADSSGRRGPAARSAARAAAPVSGCRRARRSSARRRRGRRRARPAAAPAAPPQVSRVTSPGSSCSTTAARGTKVRSGARWAASTASPGQRTGAAPEPPPPPPVGGDRRNRHRARCRLDRRTPLSQPVMSTGGVEVPVPGRGRREGQPGRGDLLLDARWPGVQPGAVAPPAVAAGPRHRNRSLHDARGPHRAVRMDQPAHRCGCGSRR